MLIEIWERLRGYDKWIEAEAKVESSAEQKTVVQTRGGTVDEWSSDDVIAWTDARGEKQCADFTAKENSRLFQLIEGDKVIIRYNPSNPEEFYYRDLLRDRARKFALRALLILFFLTFIVLRIWTAVLMTH